MPPRRPGQGQSLPACPAAGPGAASAAPTRAAGVTPAEQAVVLQVINSAGYADLSIGQIWARELDEGRYWCSMSSMYRIARAAGQTRERRRQATHPARVKPELVADGPSQVWSWDITKLRGPAKGVWFHLYVLIDIYSRYNPGWIVAAAEDSVLAKDFIDEAIHPERDGAAHRARRPGHLDDIQAGVGVARRPRRDPYPFPAACLERQSLCATRCRLKRVDSQIGGRLVSVV